jgi:YidC/Oxa1 family membrane protein insertase
MDENNRNFLMAIILSVAVLLAWQAFYNGPKQRELESQRQQQAPQEQASKPPQPGTTPAPAPTADGSPPTPSASPGAPSIAPAPAGTDRKTALAATRRVAVETPRLSGSISLMGGRIDDLVLTKYRVTVKPTSQNVTLFSPSGSTSPFYAEHGWTGDGSAKLKLPTAQTKWTLVSGDKLTPDSPVTLEWDNGEGLLFRRIISVDDSYLFSVRQEVENKSANPVTLHPYALISRHGRPQVQSFYILHEGLIGVLGDDGLQEIDYDDAVEDKTTSFKNVKGGWLGITDKYWAAVVIPNQQTPYQGRFSGNVVNGKERFQTDYLASAVQVAPGATGSVEGLLFAGAKEVDVVDRNAETHNIDRFDLLIDWGWFYFLTKPLFFMIDFFYKLVGNFGIAILIVTVLIKLVMFPLANKSYVSMSKMKKLQPEMTRIKERYADDKTRQQQALMDLYKTEKVNPASGCLPILVQIPVFFALYKVLFVTIEMRHAPFYGWIQDLSAPDPTTLFNLFGLIPWDPPNILQIGIWPLIMGATMFVQMRLNPAPPDPVQAKVFAWMPVIFTFLLAPFPAGLVIYWAWNNLLSILQQAFIMKRQGVPITLFENIGLKKGAGGRT